MGRGSAVELLTTGLCGCCKLVRAQGEAWWKTNLLTAIEYEEPASRLSCKLPEQGGCRQKQHYEIALF